MKMKKNGKYMTSAAILLLAASLLPLLWIGRYNVLSADDYSMCKGMHKLIQEGAGIKSLFFYAWTYARNLYQSWRGYYIANYIEVFNPGAFSEQAAFVTPILMLAMITASLYIFCRCVVSAFFGKGYQRETVLIWALFTFMNIQTMRSPAEGFYWFAGAVSYTGLHYLAILFVGFMLWGNEISGMRNKIIYMLAASVLAFIAGGSQYTTELICVILWVFFLVVCNKKIGWHRLVPGCILCIGFLVSLLAPGNMARRGETNGMSAVSAILHSFTEAAHFARQSISPLFVVVLLALLPCIWKMVTENKKKWRFRYPLVVFFFSYCVFAASFTPSLYGVGNIDAGRIKNQIQIVFYLLVYADAFYGLGWLARKTGEGEREVYCDMHTVISVLGKYTAVLQGIFFVLVLLVFAGTSDKNTFSSVSALRSLANGEAKTYYGEAQERLTDYKNPDVTVVEAEPFSVKPHVLYFTDIVEEGEPNYWINENIAAYYGKEKVILRKSQ